nr:SOS response-associated peptidase family protein [Adlercreutzia rubneri]
MDGERIEGDWVSDGEGASFVGDRGGDLTRVDLLWGVDVSWKRGLVFNARIESALSGSGLWSEAVENGRCIVPVRAFYETRNVDGGTGGRKPQYRFASAGGTALLLAGLRLGDRFVLVTCEPDAVVGRVHSRMPLSLTAPEALAWLDRSTDARDLLARHAPVPLEAQEEPAPTRRPSDSDQMSLF